MKKRIIPALLAVIMLISAFAVPVGAVTTGDVNNDSRINALDIRLLALKASGENPLNFSEAAADINGDGKINSRDVTALMNSRFNSLGFTQNPSYPALSYGLSSVELGADSVTVDEGATSATVPVRIYNVPMQGVSTIAFSVSISGKATVTEIENAVGHGLSKSDNSGYLWVATNTGIFEEGAVIANVTFKLSGDAKPGEYYNVTLATSTDVDDCVTFNGGSSDTPASLGAKVSYNGKIIVAENPSDYGKITLSAADVTVTEGAATADVTVTVGNIPTDLGLASCNLSVSADGGASVTDVSLLIPNGNARINDGVLLWYDYKIGIFESSVEFAKITVALPANAKAGDTFRVTLGASDADGNYITLESDPTTGDPLSLGAEVVRSATVTVAAKPKLGFSAADVTVYEGASSADVIVTVSNIPTDLGLSSCYLSANASGGASVINIASLMPSGSAKYTALTGAFLWTDNETGVFTSTARFAKITVALPESAKAGDTFTVTPAVSSHNNLTFRNGVDGSPIELSASVVRTAKITVAAKPEEKTITLSADSARGLPGETVSFDVYAEDIDGALGLSSFYMYVYTIGLKVTNVEFLCAAESDATFYEIEKGGVDLKWESRKGGVFDAKSALVRIYVEIPSKAELGKEYEITISPAEKTVYFQSANTVDDEKICYYQLVKDGAKVTVGEEEFIPGDLNGDKKLNSRDVIMIMKAILADLSGEPTPTGFKRANADLNKDGKLNNRDVILVMRAALSAVTQN